MLFKDGQKITMISVSEFLATTIKREIRITRTVNGRAAYTLKGKRKEYYFEPKHDPLVFEGWGLPITVDTDTLDFAGNGCYNFVTTTPELLRKLIDTGNINKAFSKYEDILYVSPDNTKHYIPLYKTK